MIAWGNKKFNAKTQRKGRLKEIAVRASKHSTYTLDALCLNFSLSLRLCVFALNFPVPFLKAGKGT